MATAVLYIIGRTVPIETGFEYEDLKAWYTGRGGAEFLVFGDGEDMELVVRRPQIGAIERKADAAQRPVQGARILSVVPPSRPESLADSPPGTAAPSPESPPPETRP